MVADYVASNVLVAYIVCTGETLLWEIEDRLIQSIAKPVQYPAKKTKRFCALSYLGFKALILQTIV